MGSSWSTAAGKGVFGGEGRRWRSDVGKKGAPVGDLIGAWVCELRGSAGEVVRTSIRPEDGGGELSAAEGLWRRRSYVFRRVYGLGLGSSARMSYRGAIGSSRGCLSAKRCAVVACA